MSTRSLCWLNCSVRYNHWCTGAQAKGIAALVRHLRGPEGSAEPGRSEALVVQEMAPDLIHADAVHVQRLPIPGRERYKF